MRKLMFLLLVVGLFAKESSAVWGWDGPFTLQEVKFDISDPALPSLDFRATGTTRLYRYYYKNPGNSLEEAKVFMSMLLSANSSRRRVKVYAEWNGSGEVYRFNVLSVLD